MSDEFTVVYYDRRVRDEWGGVDYPFLSASTADVWEIIYRLLPLSGFRGLFTSLTDKSFVNK